MLVSISVFATYLFALIFLQESFYAQISEISDAVTIDLFLNFGQDAGPRILNLTIHRSEDLCRQIINYCEDHNMDYISNPSFLEQFYRLIRSDESVKKHLPQKNEFSRVSECLNDYLHTKSTYQKQAQMIRDDFRRTALKKPFMSFIAYIISHNDDLDEQVKSFAMVNDWVRSSLIRNTVFFESIFYYDNLLFHYNE